MLEQYGDDLDEREFDDLQRTVLGPIAARLFPREGGALDRHHSFVVRYQVGSAPSRARARGRTVAAPRPLVRAAWEGARDHRL